VLDADPDNMQRRGLAPLADIDCLGGDAHHTPALEKPEVI
jgi:hypothetical protein